MSTLEAGTTAPVRRPEPGWTELTVAVLGYLALSVVVTVGVLAVQTPPNAAIMVASTGFATFAAVGLALAVRVRSLGCLHLRLPGRRWLLAALAVGVGLRGVIILIVLAWQHVTGDTTNPQQYLLDGALAGGWTLVGLIVFGGLVVPLAEELFFRGVVYSSLRRYGPVIATLGSAALFGLAHGLSVVLVVAVLLGAVNAVLVERSGSIWPAVVVHATNNMLAFAAAALLL